MTKEKERAALTKLLIDAGENYLQSTSSQIDYQKITDEIWEISGAKFVIFNLFNEDGDKFTTLAISGKSSLIKMGNSLISTKMIGKQWDNDLARYEKIKDRNLTKFESLKELAGDVVGKPIIELIEKTFTLGSIYLIKIMRNEIMLGDFTIIMVKNVEIKNVDILEIYTRQLGLFLSRAKEEEQVRHLSFHDHLTGLYNRRFYEEELKRLDSERNYPLTIAIGDCNGLKLINDSFGHSLGDELIKKTGEVIKLACRTDDIVARLGGDEFVILLPKTGPSDASEIIKRINEIAKQEKVGPVGISIAFGIGTKYNKTDNLADIFKKAEDEMYKQKLYESSSKKNSNIDLIMSTLFEKSSREMLHSKGVSEVCVRICNQMGLNKEATNKLRIAGLMHDIGKISLEKSNLNGKVLLNEEETIEMEKHPEVGYRLLSAVNEFSSIADYILQHHERWDGQGYPKGLKKEEICLEARIISVADAFDSMTNVHSYKKILTKEEALKEIREAAGTQFDPNIVKALLKSYYI